MSEWGHEAQQRMGRCRERLWRAIDQMDDAGAHAFVNWLLDLTDGQAVAVYRKLAA